MNKFFLLLFLPLLIGAASYEINVPANVEWFDSEITVSTGEQVTITTEGVWQYDPRPNFKTGPNGLINGQLSLGALQMKCNDYVYLVGSSWEGIVPENCVLKFGMYDNIGHANNVGSLNVNVKIVREHEEELDEDNNEDEEIEEDKLNDNDNENNGDEEESYENGICSLVIFLLLSALGASYVYEKK